MFEELIKCGDWKIDLKRKNMRIGKHMIVENGKVSDGYAVDDMELTWEKVEEMYKNYKHSIPNIKAKASYFKALNSDELTDAELAYGVDRNEAQFELESSLLLYGSQLNMERETDWFWQSKTDRELVVLKEWL